MTTAIQLGTRRSLMVIRVGEDAGEWNRFVLQRPESTYAHAWGWREVLRDALRHECVYMAAVDDEGEWQGVLPLVRVKSRIFGTYLVSLPFVNYGGPLGSLAAQRALAAAAVDLASNSRVDMLELRGGTGEFERMTVSTRKVTVLLEMKESAEALWKWFPSKLRSQIRRAQKEQMEVRFGPEQVDAFYQVFARNMRDLGTPVLPKAFFQSIARSLRENALIGVVYDDGVPVAGGVGFVWNDRFEITWASSLREYNRKSPNMLLYWSFMEQAIERGVRVFDFGRCTPGGNTHRFKLQWGGESVELPWSQWSAKGVSSTPSPERPIYQLATKVWSRLPVPVANRLGPVLARQLP